MEHEKEPWQAIPGWVADSRQVRPWDIVNANGGDSIATTTLLENDEANARRIVACVNACAGTDNDTLHKIARMEGQLDLFARINELKQQRDELRHQLAGMTDSAKHYSNGMEYYRGLIDEAAKSIGIAMYTADDQGVHPDPLRAKLPECVSELVQQRDAAANSALDHASKYSNIVQAITDQENQPSQYGTVTLAMYNKLKQQRDELQRDAERYRWLRDYQGYSYGMGSDTPAECGIAFEWVQSRPEESTMTIDAAIDAAIAKAKE